MVDMALDPRMLEGATWRLLPWQWPHKFHPNTLTNYPILPPFSNMVEVYVDLFLNQGSQILAAFWCVLVVGSSDHGHFSGMALGERYLHTSLPPPPCPSPPTITLTFLHGAPAHLMSPPPCPLPPTMTFLHGAPAHIASLHPAPPPTTHHPPPPSPPPSAIMVTCFPSSLPPASHHHHHLLPPQSPAHIAFPPPCPARRGGAGRRGCSVDLTVSPRAIPE
jgi:hypothetical protein